MTEEPGPLRAALADTVAEMRERLRQVPWRKVFLTGAWISLCLAVLSIGTGAVLVFRLTRDLPDVRQLEAGYAPPQVTRILARDGTLLADVFSERRTVVDFREIPDHAKAAFLAAEDAGFYEHRGLDYFGLLRAMVKNVLAGRVKQGGSTITQQVVKNVLLDQERSYRRKIKETVLAYEIENKLSKDQILGIYMNHLYLGHGRYGIEEAARYYFGKHARELDPSESALLAGIIAAPERYSPRHDEKKALERRSFVLTQMRDKGFMTRASYEAYVQAPLRLVPAPEDESDLAPEIVDRAKGLIESLEKHTGRRGGFTIKTSIDPSLEVAARKAVRSGLDAYLARQHLAPPFTATSRRLWGKPFQGEPSQHGIYVGQVKRLDDAKGSIDVSVGSRLGRVDLAREHRYNPTHLVPSKFTSEGAALRVRVLSDPKSGGPGESLRLSLELGPQAALVAIDPASGDVLALIGSYEGLPGALDRATQAKRQPGSAFKPVFYSLALSTGQVTAASTFTFPKEAKQTAPAPADSAASAFDVLSLRQGIAKSDNRVAREVFRKAGPREVVAWAKTLGITARLEPDDSLALGSYEVTPLELASAYVPFASGGQTLGPNLFLEVPHGNKKLGARAKARSVMKPEVAYLMTSLLQSVVEEGTGTRARALGRPVAGKTGTTNQVKDAWFVGYSVDLVAAVWVGYDDAIPLGASESGASVALPIWIDFMRAAHERKAKADFPRPPGIVSAVVDPQTGLLARYDQADGWTEVFLEGTAPTETAPVPLPDSPPDAPAEPPPTTSPTTTETPENPAGEAATAEPSAPPEPEPAEEAPARNDAE